MGAYSNIMFRNSFDALGFKNNNLKTHQPGVMGLGDHFIKPDGNIDLSMTIGSVLTKFLVMKYEANPGEVGTILGDREVAKKYCNGNLALRKRSQDATGIFLADLDARIEE
ncbi:hypothetical protein PIB30_091548 [Stylosanthes scabra]|uniref:Uncharacterized protein n=1 Tax=Stylosanthes scabra TaxID=79078 RepID=A0ABU6WUA2_9FABA|nr:hypothetical protein [Stylosanthes scabra]